MVRLFTKMINDGITPNGLYLLMLINEGGTYELIDYKHEKEFLEKNQFICENQMTGKAHALIEKYKKMYKEAFSKGLKQRKTFDYQEEELIYQYRDLFPKGMLPSGSPARQAFKELEKKFVWFFSNYNYNWETILKATKLYVEKYKQENYMYMKTSGYFIVKHEKGIEVSTLATYCDMVVDLKEEISQTLNQDTDSYSNAI